jgi:hypothetical protein
MQTATYIRKPFEVEGVQVTAENMNEVAVWAGGQVVIQDGNYIKIEVKQVINEKQTKAFVGDWVLKAGSSFKVYTNVAFTRNFEPKDPPEELRTVTTDGLGVRAG